MDFIYKLFRLDKKSRNNTITVVSSLAIMINLSIALMKIIIGSAVSSMAIISEGVNNAADACSSFLTLVGTKLAGMKPTRRYPFGFGRIEYLTNLLIGGIIFVAGSELFKESIDLIFEPEELEISYLTMGLIFASAIIKIFFSWYEIKEGRRVGSDSLIAIGKEGRQDSISSLVTLASGFAYLLFDLNVDAYASLLTASLVIKLSYEVLSDTVGKLLGQSGDKELADKIYKLIREEPLIVNAADMMLHNYGPDAYSGSVNIEIDHKRNLGDIYKLIHQLQLRIMHEYGITMVFGLYAIDNDNPESKAMRLRIAEFIRGYQHLVSYHALYVDAETKDIYIDLVVDYELKDWEKLRKDFTQFMHEHYPNQGIELVIETQYV